MAYLPDGPEHSSLGPSRWDRVLECTASVRATEHVPDDPGYEALEGTVFHAMAEMCLRYDLEPECYLDWQPRDDIDIVVDRQMVEAVKPGLERIRELASRPGAKVFVELRVDLSPWCGIGQFGTADVVIIFPEERVIIIVDWKYGYVLVNPMTSYQPRGYALGVWGMFGDYVFGGDTSVTVEMVIEQPRLSTAYRRHTMTVSDLLDFGRHVAQRASEVGTAAEAFRPSHSACVWCPIEATCAHRKQFILDAMCVSDAWLDKQEDPAPLPELTPSQRAYLIRIRPQITRWLTRQYGIALADAQRGRPTPGLRLSEGRRGNREYIPTRRGAVRNVLVGHLGADAYRPQELISPAQAEKALGKETYATHVEPFVERRASVLHLVPEESDAPRAEPQNIVRPEDFT